MASQHGVPLEPPFLSPLEPNLGTFIAIPLTEIPGNGVADRSRSTIYSLAENIESNGATQDDEAVDPSRAATVKQPLLVRSSSSASSIRSLEPIASPIARISRTFSSVHSRWNSRLKQSRFHGWRMGVVLGCCMSFFVLCCNIGLIIAGAKSKTGYNSNGIADLVHGEEPDVSRYNTLFHVLINALSTVLLSGSNYTMQVLSSPSRRDIDKAHAKGQWLDIGILSPRNLLAIPRSRSLLWLALALSSIPLHLFYNASIFKIITANDYNILTVENGSPAWKVLHESVNSTGAYVQMTNQEWNVAFRRNSMSVYGDLYLAIDRIAFDSLQNVGSTNMSDYLSLNMTGTQKNIMDLTSESQDWIPSEHGLDNSTTSVKVWLHVAHGFAQKKDVPSRVQISLYFMIVVVVFNFAKLVIMALVLFTGGTSLVTLGDAAASFLEKPDSLTIGKSTLGKEEIVVNMGYPPLRPISTMEEQKDLADRARGVWKPGKIPYFRSVIRREKVFYTQLILYVAILMLLAPMYSQDVQDEGAVGFLGRWGSASTDSLSISASNPLSSTATLYNALLVNIPQLLLSFGYLNLNTICTSIASCAEWNSMAVMRKGLRVTNPQGDQRSTYFLQLPYKWSLPLMLTSGTLHWLLSQSFFLARIDRYDRQGSILLTQSISACGFSTFSLYALLIASLAVLGIVGLLGLRKLQVKTPVIASCSLAISAACHPRDGEKDVQLGKVKWGVVGKEEAAGNGRCALSTGKVERPEEGKLYR